jgi:hypothetical protein
MRATSRRAHRTNSDQSGENQGDGATLLVHPQPRLRRRSLGLFLGAHGLEDLPAHRDGLVARLVDNQAAGFSPRRNPYPPKRENVAAPEKFVR